MKQAGTRPLPFRADGVPLRSWIAPLPRLLELARDHLEYERTIGAFPPRIASMRRSCEILKARAASRPDYLRAVRLQEILAEASHLVSTVLPNSESEPTS
jgi:hypothetical protein